MSRQSLRLRCCAAAEGREGTFVEEVTEPPLLGRRVPHGACNPLLSGTGGGHDIHLRDLGRQGIGLHGHLEAADDGELTFTDDLPERFATVEVGFGQHMGKALVAPPGWQWACAAG